MDTRNHCLLTISVEMPDTSPYYEKETSSFLDLLKERIGVWADTGKIQVIAVFHKRKPPVSLLENIPDWIIPVLLTEECQPARWNICIQKAKGDYVSFLADGVSLAPNALTLLLSALEGSTNRKEKEPSKQKDWDALKLSECTSEEIQSFPSGAQQTKSQDSITYIDLEKRIASQPYQLNGLLLNISLFRENPFPEDLGTWGYGPWFIRTFPPSSRIGIVKDAFFYKKQEVSSVDSMDRIRQEVLSYGPAFFEKYIQEPFQEYWMRNKQIPCCVQVSLLRNIAGCLLWQKESPFEGQILQLLDYFEERVIRSAPRLTSYQKNYFLYKKSEHLKTYTPADYPDLQSLPVYLDSIEIRDGKACITGFAVSLCFQKNIHVYGEVDGDYYETEHIERTKFHQKLWGKILSVANGFFFSVPLKEQTFSFRIFFQEEGGTIYVRKNLHFRRQCCLADGWKTSYSAQGKWLIYAQDGNICFEPGSKLRHLQFELRLLKSLYRSSDVVLQHASRQRALIQVKRFFQKKEIWLISDKTFRADDNGEAFFLWLNKEKPSGIHPYFLLDEDSPDFRRLSKFGTVVPCHSEKHKELFLRCTCNISAYSPSFIRCPPELPPEGFSDLCARPRQIFLQHGITHNDVSGSLEKYSKGFHLVTCAAPRERDSFLAGEYHYFPEEIALTGLARYDRLYQNKQKIITFAPTWRQELLGPPSTNDIRPLVSNFTESAYWKNVLGFLHNQTFLDAAEYYGYTIQFIPHPVLHPYLKTFALDPRIRIPNESICYRDVFAESSLLITDYSSIAFDFAYLEKPVLYFQFDKEEFFQGEHYKKGYFDYEKDGFGQVVESLEEVVEASIHLMKNHCRMEEIYLKRVRNFYAFHDRENCRRIYEAIKKLLSSYSLS